MILLQSSYDWKANSIMRKYTAADIFVSEPVRNRQSHQNNKHTFYDWWD